MQCPPDAHDDDTGGDVAGQERLEIIDTREAAHERSGGPRAPPGALPEQAWQDAVALVHFVQAHPGAHDLLQERLLEAMLRVNERRPSLSLPEVDRWTMSSSSSTSAPGSVTDGVESISNGSLSSDSDSGGKRGQQPLGVVGGNEAAQTRVTTLTVHGIPASYSRDMLLHQWPPDGGSYDFLHLRCSHSTVGNTRLAIINFTSTQPVDAFRVKWHGVFLPGSREPLSVVTSAVQGRDLNLMLVLDRPEVAPLLIDRGRALSDELAMQRVRLAKLGIFVTYI